MTKMRHAILLIEDNPAHAELVTRSFEPHAERFQLQVRGTLKEAKAYLSSGKPNLVIADLILPDGQGVELLTLAEGELPFPVVIMTSQGDEKAAVEAMKAGALDYIVKSAAALADMPHIAGQVLREWGHITERKRAEAALAEERERLAVTLRSIGDGVITTDNRGRITMMNTVAEQLTEWTQQEAQGKPLEAVFNIINELTRERCENPVAKVLDSGGIVGLANNTVLIGKSGTERVIADSGAPIFDTRGRTLGVVLVFRDVTQKRRMEKELQKAEKLESLSVLAGGIAHDFNNALMAIIGNISLAKLYAEPGKKVFEKLEEIERAALRTKDLTQQMLTFSKGGAPFKRVISLGELIKDTVKFSLRGSNVQCRFSIPDELWSVEVDAGQISQVINNIIINADQSMPEGGFVHIRAENVTLEAASLPPAKAGKYVKTIIQDNGIGIAREHLSKIYDPYFTTKQKGSGLGLAVVYSIVEKHDGYVVAESELNVGTTFSIYLPAVPSAPAPNKIRQPRLIKGDGKILLMDDDPPIREVAGEMLRALGYRVDCAQDGDEALELYEQAYHTGMSYDAAILDLTIPGGMGGRETLERILEVDPQASVIVSSGYSNDQVISKFREYGFKGAVSKPYQLQDLSKTLHTILKEKPDPKQA